MKRFELTLVILLSIMIQLVAVIFFAEEELVSDGYSYDRTAVHFAKTGELIEPVFTVDSSGNVTFEDMPFSEGGLGFPIYLGIIYKLFGHEGAGQRMALVIQGVLLGIVIPLCVYLLLSQVFFTSVAATRLGTWAMVLWPSGPELSRMVMTEATSVITFMVFFTSVCLALKNKSVSRKIYVWLTVSGALLFFIRYEFLIIISGALGLLAIFLLKNKSNLKGLIVSSVVLFSLFTIPAIRNYGIFNRFIPLSTSGGKVLWLGAMCTGTFGFTGENAEVFKRAFVPNDVDLTNKNLGDMGAELIRKDPINYLKCSAKRLYKNLFVGFYEYGWSDADTVHKVVKIYKRVFKIIIVLGFLLSLPLLFGQNPWLFSFVVLIFSYKYLFIHTFMVGGSRFFTLFEPVAIVLTCFILGKRGLLTDKVRTN